MRLLKHTTLLLSALLVSCILDSGNDDGISSAAAPPGTVRLQVRLNNPGSALLKRASADTTFSLDSLKIILTAPGAATRTYSYPISGQPDTGSIAVSSLVFDTLPSLRTWKAKILTIDTSLNPSRMDTVNLDSVSFLVSPAETTSVTKTVSAAFSVLRARFVSNSPGSISSGIEYIRLRVDGVTRDSAILGATLNDVEFPSATTGFAVGMSGKILTTTNSGATWSVLTATPTSNNLNSASFSSTSTGWVAGDGGIIFKTTNGGSSWAPEASGTTESLTKIFSVDASNVFAVGAAGGILKTQDGGATWTSMKSGWFSLSSGTAQDLTAAIFADTLTGYAAGTSGTLLKTTNGGASWTAQTSGTAQTLNALYDSSASTHLYAVGNGGTILKTTNGSTWVSQTSGSTSALNTVSFVNGKDSGVVVGDSEILLITANGSTWSDHSGGWAPQTSGITQNANAVFFTDVNTGWMVCDGGVIRHTTNGGSTWSAQTSGTTKDLNAVSFASATIGLAVGASGTVCHTGNGGTSWTCATSGTSGFNGVAFVAGRTDSAYAVGDNGVGSRTVNGGSSWSAVTASTIGGGTGSLRSIVFENGSTGVIVGDNGVVRKLTLSGSGGSTNTYATGGTPSGSPNLKSVDYCNTINDFTAVGDGGKIFKTTNFNSATPTWTSETSNTTENLAQIHFVDANNAYVVSASGNLLKTTNAGTAWSEQGTGASELNGVFFATVDTGFAAGNGGAVFKTLGGGNWSGKRTVPSLNGAYMFNSSAMCAVGDSGTILRSTNGGLTWAPFNSGTQTLNAVYFTSATTGWAVGNAGTILKTTNFGNTTPTWTQEGSGVTAENLTQVYFLDATHGFAVGSSGIVLKTINGGTAWTAQDTVSGALSGLSVPSTYIGYAVGSSGKIFKTTGGGAQWNTVPLYGAYFASAASGWVVGASGTIDSTEDGGRTWTAQSAATTQTLNAIDFGNGNRGVAVGNRGTFCNTTNAGTAWSCQTAGTANLYGVSAASATVAYAVGDSGKIWHSTNINSAPAAWSALTSGTTEPLQAVVFPSTATTGYAVGGRTTILGTANSGTSWIQENQGAREFDTLLTYKYLRPGIPHTVILDAVDTLAGALRGYQATLALDVSTGKDTTVGSATSLIQCGGTHAACTP